MLDVMPLDPPTVRCLTALVEAVRSEFVTSEVVANWATARLDTLTRIPSWFSDLCWCVTKDETLGALWDGIHAQHSAVADKGLPQPESGPAPVALYFGFLYLRFERGDINAATLLDDAGDRADASGWSQPECETFYMLLNEIDGGGPTQPAPDPLITRIERLFSSFRITALAEWNRLWDAA